MLILVRENIVEIFLILRRRLLSRTESTWGWGLEHSVLPTRWKSNQKKRLVSGFTRFTPRFREYLVLYQPVNLSGIHHIGRNFSLHSNRWVMSNDWWLGWHILAPLVSTSLGKPSKKNWEKAAWLTALWGGGSTPLQPDRNYLWKFWSNFSHYKMVK